MGKLWGAVLVLLLTGTSFAKNNHNPTQDMQWNRYGFDKNQTQFSQSNALAFWSSFSLGDESPLGPYLAYQGWIVGDAHPDNFALQFDGKSWWPVLSDFDDGGEGPFVLDLIRYLSVSDRQSRAMQKELVASYRAGLCGKEPILSPEMLSRIPQSWPVSDDVDPRTRTFLQKKRAFFLMPQRIKQEIKKFLPPGKWKHSVVAQKKRGGSAGLNRFWVLLEEPSGRLRHFELKQLKLPATDVFIEQKSHSSRIQNLQETYWPKPLQGQQSVVSLWSEEYLLRERIKNPLKINKSSEYPHTQFLVDQLWLQYLGWRHGQQPSGSKFCQKIQEQPIEFSKVILQQTERNQKVESQEFSRSRIEHKSYRLFGDVRFRLQNRNKQDSDPRIQQKVRARIGSQFFINENIKSRFSVSTGRSPTSANANLGDSFSYKSFGIHEASIAYDPASEIGIILGKMKLPFAVVGDSEIVWDNTLTPEGVAMQFKRESGLWRPFLNLGYFMVEENFRKSQGIDQPDITLLAIQFGLKVFWNSYKLTLAGGPIRYSQIKGTLFEDIGEDSQSGNSSNGQDGYLYNFHMNELFFELKRRGFLNLSIFAHAVENSASEDNQAFRVGLSGGYESLKWIYAYREVEKDSVFGYFTESNFAFGGTDQKGHEVSLVWKIAKKFRLKVSQHWSQLGVDAQRDSMKRTHLDFKVKF